MSSLTKIRNKSVTRFFMSNMFTCNARLKLAKKQAKAKQHPEDELLLFENFHILHPCYHPKIIGHTLKKKQQKKKHVYIHEIIQLIITKMEEKKEK